MDLRRVCRTTLQIACFSRLEVRRLSRASSARDATLFEATVDRGVGQAARAVGQFHAAAPSDAELRRVTLKMAALLLPLLLH